jgi:hypothetical protein
LKEYSVFHYLTIVSGIAIVLSDAQRWRSAVPHRSPSIRLELLSHRLKRCRKYENKS